MLWMGRKADRSRLWPKLKPKPSSLVLRAILRLGCLGWRQNWPGAVSCSSFKGFRLPRREKLEFFTVRNLMK
ncbi:Fibrillin-3, partial [Manis pentadactyla]